MKQLFSSVAVVGCALVAAGAALPDARAQQAAVGTRSTSLALPSLAIPEKELGNARKYWLLHKPGITIDQATADFSFCWHFLPLLPRGAFRPVPGFVAWQKPNQVRAKSYTFGPYGIVGDVIGAMFAGPLERSMQQSRMFRCMVPRGYDRYRTSEVLWRQLYEGEPQQAIALLSSIAAGPVPPTPKVSP